MGVFKLVWVPCCIWSVC